MKKTILEWFEEAKANGADWADAAIDNARGMTGEWVLNVSAFSHSDALERAFVWASSPQKRKYWQSICEKIEQEEQNA